MPKAQRMPSRWHGWPSTAKQLRFFDRPAPMERDVVEALLRSIGRLVPRPRLLSLLKPRLDPVEWGRRSIAQVASAARMSPGSSLAAAFDGFVAGRGIAAADLSAFGQLMAADYRAELRRRLGRPAITAARFARDHASAW